MVELYWKSNINPIFGRPPGRPLGGSGGADAPPGIKLSCVFSQPRASTHDALRYRLVLKQRGDPPASSNVPSEALESH